MMKQIFISLCALILFPIIGSAQDLKVLDVVPVENSSWQNDFPTDFNGNKCALIVLNLTNESVAFEGNIIGTPTYIDGMYYVFLTPKSKYLNIKYPGEKPLMINFSKYNIASLSSETILQIEMNEPSSNISEQLEAGIGDVSEEADDLYEKGMLLMSNNDYVNAFDLFTQAYELGHPKAAYQLGYIYSDPYHLVNNKLMKKFANIYGSIPDNPVKRDMQKAFALYKESAEAGYVTAQYAVGECLEKGEGVKKNKEEAMVWYGKAAEQGHLQAREKMGEKIRKNRTMGVITSYGSSDNEFILNEINEDVNDLTAITYPRKDKNNEFCALIKVRLPFENVTFTTDSVGEPIFKTNEYWVYVPQNTKEIIISYPDFQPLKVNFKNAGINNIIAKNTYNVSISFPIDLLKDDSNLSSEDLYKIGLGYMERRDNQYIRWMTKAVDKGHPQAKYRLGTCYVNGTGVKKDKEKGLALLESASEQGAADASYFLGLFYEKIERNKKMAQLWYDKAAEQGYDAAKGKKAKNIF